jgi:hypothetical protein
MGENVTTRGLDLLALAQWDEADARPRSHRRDHRTS